ncbi:MAG: BrnA antitoxin family protein [Candidatus Rokubacteria bacterium]|nr:BrnA antitoxin family protein [Candidatus Rokubacteria bacterium]
MSARSTSKASRTDWQRATAQRDRAIKIERGHPEADPAHIVRGIVRRGLKPPAAKESISLRVDPEVLGWFRAQGPGWQTRINSVLRAYKEAASLSRALTRRSSGRP